MAWNPEPDRAAMAGIAALWAGFPVAAEPRQLVLVAEPIDLPGFTGGATGVEWLEGRIEVGPIVPQAALAALAAAGGPTGSGGRSRSGLRVRSATRGQRIVPDRSRPGHALIDRGVCLYGFVKRPGRSGSAL